MLSKVVAENGQSQCVTNTASWKDRNGVWSCMRDGGRSSEAGSQVLASNHCKLRSSKAAVVSVAAKGETRSRQVWSGEASVSEPLMTCRNPLVPLHSGFDRLRLSEP